MFNEFVDALMGVVNDRALWPFFKDDGWLNLVMILLSFVLLYLGIKKEFEPLLLVPIAFGMFLANLPLANLGVQYSDLGEFTELFKQGALGLTRLSLSGSQVRYIPAAHILE